MYRCVMGMTGSGANGCILADEMGLGKTLQTIALIYTLCRELSYAGLADQSGQSPFFNESQVFVVGEAYQLISQDRSSARGLPCDAHQELETGVLKMVS